MKRAHRNRKVTPEVKDGLVRKKDRHQLTAAMGYVISREPAGHGSRHILSARDVRDFADLIPGWDELSIGIESIVMTAGGKDHHGRYRTYRLERTSSIEIPAWDGDLWIRHSRPFFDEHRAFFERIGLAFDEGEGAGEDEVECRYTEAQARAFLLLHVFLHELGHHVDRMQTKQRKAGVRGEAFAERWANDLAARIWPRYVQRFGDPRR
jgi:hypothetical protein